MKVNARDFFNRAEKERIRQSVQAAEKKTSGEIAVMLVDASDRYREAEFVGAVGLAGLVALILSIAFHHLTIWFYIPVTFVFFFPFWYLVWKIPQLKLPFVSRRRAAEAVRERAVFSFYRKSLHKTRHETGILIFISLLERKVVMLGDRGINEKIEQGFWGTLAGRLSAGIREGKAMDGLTEVIARCGEELQKHFPVAPDDKNELADDIICEDGTCTPKS